MSTRPNILFLMTDQHSVRSMGDHPDTPVETPNLMQLAAEGVRFDAAYCQNPLCVPSRSSLHTGKYGRTTGIYDNQHILPANGPTLARSLSDGGYRTALIGKSHFNGEQFQGFQQRPYGDLYGQAHQPDPRRHANESGLGDILADAGPSGIPLPMTQTEICVAEATKWLQGYVARPDAPFFLAVHFDKPHFPINPPPALYDRFAGQIALPNHDPGWLDRAPSFVQTAANASGTARHRGDAEVNLRALAAYYGCVEWIDDAVGRLLQVLDYLDLSRDTLVVYCSDHGEMAAQRGLWQKTLFYEDSARVPLIIRWPGQAQAGVRSDQPAGLIDLFPTLCAAAGVTPPDDIEGIDLAPALSRQDLPKRDLFCESVVLKQPDYAGCMMRRDRWKYALYLDGSEELYDLSADPDEWTDLAGAPATAALRDELRQTVRDFWQPESFRARYDATPRMPHEKHFYPYSNQYLTGDGRVFDARP
ncbi:MAG: hypothetical protein CMH12_05680 [Maritimibacter sp.]|nr:hypothetical protein [Maritimibacter sp.]